RAVVPRARRAAPDALARLDARRRPGRAHTGSLGRDLPGRRDRGHGARVQLLRRRIADAPGSSGGDLVSVDGAAPLLELDHVEVGFATDDGVVSAVSAVSLAGAQGEIFGLGGESGCGKTTLAMATMGLLPASASVRGAVRFEGRDLVGLDPEELRRLRRGPISSVV